MDTSALVALLDNGDPEHERVATVFAEVRGAIYTTGPVLTEAFHLLRYATAGAERLVDVLEATGATIVDVFGLEDLRAMTRLMKKYADQPMDFADASLVWVAESRGEGRVLTLDERGFRTYRFRGTKRFHLVVQDG